MINQDVSVNVRIDFECFYLLENPIELNAHRYRWAVAVTCPQRLIDEGRILSFEELRKLMKDIVPDKCYLYTPSTMDTVGKRIGNILSEHTDNVVALPFIITAECLCSWLVNSLQTKLDKHYPGVFVITSSLKENSSDYVTWKKESHANRY